MIKRSQTLALTAFLCATSLSLVCHASPWRSPEELFEAADLVADVSVISTSCDGFAEDTGNYTKADYLSELEVIAVHKGEDAETLDYQAYDYRPKPGVQPFGCSPGSTAIPKGWVGRIYLRAEEDGSYAALGADALTKDLEASVVHALPSCMPPADPNEDADQDDVAPSPSSDAEPTDLGVAEKRSQTSRAKAKGCSVGGSVLEHGHRGPLAPFLLVLGLLTLGLGRRWTLRALSQTDRGSAPFA